MGQMGGAAARADEGLAAQRPMQQHNSPARATRRMRDLIPNCKAITRIVGVVPAIVIQQMKSLWCTQLETLGLESLPALSIQYVDKKEIARCPIEG